MSGNRDRIGNGDARNDVLATMQAIVNGVETNLDNKTLVLNRVAITSSALVASLQNVIAAYQAAQAARAAWIQAVSTQHALVDAIQPTIVALRAYIVAVYGEQSAEYKSFGFTPRRKSQPSAEAKALANQKRLATRAARKTMGSRQRLKIRGVVPTTTNGSTGSSGGAH
jgi:hypothetical protein